MIPASKVQFPGPDRKRGGKNKDFRFTWGPGLIKKYDTNATVAVVSVAMGKDMFGWYRDEEYLRLRIFNLHNSTYALTG